MRLLDRLNSPITFAVVLLVILALTGFFFYRYQQALQSTGDETDNAPDEAASRSLKEEPTPAEETTSPPVEEHGGGVRVRVSVMSEPVGLDVWVDGSKEYDTRDIPEGVLNPGWSEEFEAEEAVRVSASDGGAVEVSVNGEDPEPLGLRGRSARRVFTP